MRVRYFLSMAAVAAVVVVMYGNGFPFSSPMDDTPIETASLEPAMDDYGVPVGPFDVVEEHINYGQVFSDLLTPYGLDYESTVLLAQASKDVFDVRSLRAERPYRVYVDDSLGTAKYLVYERDQTSSVVFDVDAMSARVSERPVTTRIRTVSGHIDYSLFDTLIDQGIHPLVAVKLANVFAWQIDFTRLQKGDSFRIVFEDRYVGEERVEPGAILAARFNHFGKDHFAFHFEQGDIDDYYDETGKSIRKAFLIAPVEYSRISSSYSLRRFHPVQKRYKAHLGTDYVADYGTPIVATGDGVVTHATYGRFNGNYVKIRHNSTYTTQYLHMSKIASGIRPGKAVKQGQTIGYVGHTGLATGDHVCYRFWVNGKQMDHRKLDLPSVGPIPDSYRPDFLEVRDQYIASLSAPVTVPIDPSYAMLLRDPTATTSP